MEYHKSQTGIILHQQLQQQQQQQQQNLFMTLSSWIGTTVCRMSIRLFAGWFLERFGWWTPEIVFSGVLGKLLFTETNKAQLL